MKSDKERRPSYEEGEVRDPGVAEKMRHEVSREEFVRLTAKMARKRTKIEDVEHDAEERPNK
ncbi:MAG: hypothetical protein ACR2JW_12565 [Thermomicrobiales bacterium]